MKHRSWLYPVAILLVCLLAYAPIFRGGFLWDDDAHVMLTPEQLSLRNLLHLWTQPGLMPQYYPVTHTSLWLEAKVWGLNTPAAYHVTNVLLHALSSVLLWRLLLRLAVPGAIVAAALFALHPVNVESAAWISERKNTLSCVLYLLAAIAHLHAWPRLIDADAKPKQRQSLYVASLVLFTLAVLSKSVTCSLPAALLVVGWWKRGRVAWRDALPLLPMFAIGLAAGLHTAAIERTSVGASGAAWDFSPLQRLLIASRALCFYIGKLALPWPLSFNYERWTVDPHALWQWCFLAIVSIAIVALAIVAFRFRTRGPLAAALLFGGTLFPALGFFNLYPMRFSFVADHFQYLATPAVFALAGAGAALLAKRSAVAAKSACIGVLVACGVLTFVRANVFASSERLWRDTIAKSPDAWMPYASLSAELLARPNSDLREVEQLAKQSLTLNGDQFEAQHTLATLYERTNRPVDAETQLLSAVAARPATFRTWLELARFLVRAQRPAQAIVAYTNTVKLEPRFEQGQIEFAQLLQSNGDVAGAQQQLREAIARNENSIAARARLSSIAFRLGQLDEAAKLLEEIVAREPGNAVYWNNLGAINEARGQLNAALANYAKAIELKPDFTAAQQGWMRVTAKGGK